MIANVLTYRYLSSYLYEYVYLPTIMSLTICQSADNHEVAHQNPRLLVKPITTVITNPVYLDTEIMAELYSLRKP